MTRRNASSRILFLFIAIAFVPFGCSRGPASPAGTNTNAQRVVPSPTPSGEPGAPMRVAFSTDDDAGVQIVGDLYVPEKTPAPAVLALHQWEANRSTYSELAKSLRNAGFVVLAIDGRGFGESTHGADGTVAPGWNTHEDIAAAIDYMKAQPSVDAQRIGIVGASYGASNALIFAADTPQDVRAVALLSVGLNYHESLPTEPAVKLYGDRPLLLVAAKDDPESAAATTKLGAGRGNRTRVQIYETGGHGTALLDPKVGGIDLLKTFFVKSLTGPIAAPTTTAGGEEPGSGPSPDAGASTQP